MAPVARLGKGVVQPAHEFGRRDVDRVLIPEDALLNPQDEAERFDVTGQVRKREGYGLPFIKIVKLEGLEVAQEDVAGPVVLGKRVEIRPGLVVGAV